MRARPRSRENHGSRRRHSAIPHEATPLARTLKNAHSKKSTLKVHTNHPSSHQQTSKYYCTEPEVVLAQDSSQNDRDDLRN